MRIVVVGSGGVGGYFGAKFARAGEDVTFVARGAHLQAMREQGLLIRSGIEGEWRVAAHAVETLEGEAPADIVLFCVKSYDTEAAAALLRPVVGPHTGILSLQNGVDNEDKLGRAFHPEQVMGGVSYVFSNIAAPGVIAHHQLGRVVFGEMNGRVLERTRALADACARAAIPAELSTNIRRTLWEKYVFLVSMAGTTALTRLPTHFTQQVPEIGQLWRRQLDELLSLSVAADAGLDEGVAGRCEALLASLAPGNYSSLYHDLLQGKRMELDALHGHAVRLGERYGIATPTLFTVYAALRAYQEGAPRIAV